MTERLGHLCGTGVLIDIYVLGDRPRLLVIVSIAPHDVGANGNLLGRGGVAEAGIAPDDLVALRDLDGAGALLRRLAVDEELPEPACRGVPSKRAIGIVRRGNRREIPVLSLTGCLIGKTGIRQGLCRDIRNGRGLGNREDLGRYPGLPIARLVDTDDGDRRLDLFRLLGIGLDLDIECLGGRQAGSALAELLVIERSRQRDAGVRTPARDLALGAGARRGRDRRSVR